MQNSLFFKNTPQVLISCKVIVVKVIYAQILSDWIWLKFIQLWSTVSFIMQQFAVSIYVKLYLVPQVCLNTTPIYSNKFKLSPQSVLQVFFLVTLGCKKHKLCNSNGLVHPLLVAVYSWTCGAWGGTVSLLCACWLSGKVQRLAPASSICFMWWWPA